MCFVPCSVLLMGGKFCSIYIFLTLVISLPNCWWLKVLGSLNRLHKDLYVGMDGKIHEEVYGCINVF